jgi:hypothetical protein
MLHDTDTLLHYIIFYDPFIILKKAWPVSSRQIFHDFLAKLIIDKIIDGVVITSYSDARLQAGRKLQHDAALLLLFRSVLIN